VRELTKLGLKEAKDAVDNAPTTIKEAVSKHEAEAARAKLVDVGASVEMTGVGAVRSHVATGGGTLMVTTAPTQEIAIIGHLRIRLDYFDRAGRQHHLWGRFAVPRGRWHTVELRETVGAGSGSLAWLVDRHIAASGSKLDLGTRGLTWFAVGEEYAPPGRGYAGHHFIDNVTATPTT
jgi:hypothetical protein